MAADASGTAIGGAVGGIIGSIIGTALNFALDDSVDKYNAAILAAAAQTGTRDRPNRVERGDSRGGRGGARPVSRPRTPDPMLPRPTPRPSAPPPSTVTRPPTIEPPPVVRPSTPVDLPSPSAPAGGGLGGLMRLPIARAVGRAARVLGPIVDVFQLWDVYLHSVPERWPPMSERGRRARPVARPTPAPRTVPASPDDLLGSDPDFMRRVRDLRRPAPRALPVDFPVYDPATQPVPRPRAQPRATPQPRTSPQPRATPAAAPLPGIPFLPLPFFDPLTQPRATPSPRATPRARPQPRQPSPRQPGTRSPNVPPTDLPSSVPSSPNVPLQSPGRVELPDPNTSARECAQCLKQREQRRERKKKCRVIGYETVTIRRRKCA